MTAHPLERYLSACRIAHATRAATPETAYYPAFQALLDSAGGGLKPRVHCVMGLKNQVAGMPDGGRGPCPGCQRDPDDAVRTSRRG